MKFHFVTPGWFKKSGTWKCHLGIRGWPFDNELSFVTLEGKIRYVLKERVCIGYAANVPRYFFVPCDRKVVGIRQCDKCRGLSKSHVCEMCDMTRCRIPELDMYCQHLHYVYLAFFSVDDVKVGITTSSNFENRIVEQGAILALKIAWASNRLEARELERTVAKELGVTEKIPTKKKESLFGKDWKKEDLLDRIDQFEAKLEGTDNRFIQAHLFPNIERVDVSRYYDLSFLGEKILRFSYKKNEIIEGTLVTSIGSLSLIEFDRKYWVLNLKELSGWVIDTDSQGYHQAILA